MNGVITVGPGEKSEVARPQGPPDLLFKIRAAPELVEIVDFGSLHGPLLPQNPMEEGEPGGRSPPAFPVSFAVGGGPLRPPKGDDFWPGPARILK